ncbi:GNAT family N-acetyltransferase [Mycoplasmatota bacterium WC44]
MKTVLNNYCNIDANKYKLRRLSVDDSKDVYEIFSDFEVVKYQQIPPMESVEQARQAILNFQKSFDDGTKIRWAIVDETSKTIGIISLQRYDEETQSVYIGFMLNKEYWGKGVMTDVASSLISYLFSNSKIVKVFAEVLPENTGSRKLCEKLGFTEIGFLEKSVFNFRDDSYEDQYVYQKEK